MTLSPQDLKDKLLRTLDKDYNVIDMAGALDLLSVLERYPVTRETLEQTRIGRYVNEMRKRTTNKELAKRIKSLVRKWQLLLNPPATPVPEPAAPETGTRVNGKGPINSRLLDGHPHLKAVKGIRPASPASRPETPCSIRSSISSPRSNHGTPSVVGPTVRRDGTEASLAGGLPRCATDVPLYVRSVGASPLVGITAAQQRMVTAKLHSAPTTPVNSLNVGGQPDVGAMSRAASYVTSGKRKREDEEPHQPGIKLKIMKKNTAVDGEVHFNDRVAVASTDVWSCTAEPARKPGINGMLSTPSDAVTVNASSVSAAPHSSMAVKGRRGRPPNTTKSKTAPSHASSTVSAHTATLGVRTESVNRPDVTLPASAPKVATTAELIQQLHARGDLRLTSSDTLRAIASDRIVKESYSDYESVVPAAAKPRARKKNSVMPPLIPETLTLSQIKNERVQEFLESSVHSYSDPGLMNLIEQLDPPPDPESMIECSPSAEPKKPLSRPTSTTALSPTRTAKTENEPTAFVDPSALLPPIDPAQIDWQSLEYEASDPTNQPPVTDDDVERLHTLQWPCVNGQYDYKRDWADWTNTYSVPSYNGELLHILPYVNIVD